MDEWNVVHPYNWILLSHKKAWSTDTHYNRGEPRKHMLCERSQIKSRILHDSACGKCPEEANPNPQMEGGRGAGRDGEGPNGAGLLPGWKCSGIRSWWWSHDMVNVLDATELEHFKTVKLVNCVIYTVPQFKKKKGGKRRPRGCEVLNTWSGAHSSEGA